MKKSKAVVVGLLLASVTSLILSLQSLNAAASSGGPLLSQNSEKFSVALESQVSCLEPLNPARAIGALQRAGMIERSSYLNIDSLNYFKARKPLSVWGFKVVSVFGFAQNPRIFERGPGTAPPITLGVVVPYSEARVKTKLLSLGLRRVRVQRAVELDLSRRRSASRVLTEIYCIDHNQ